MTQRSRPGFTLFQLLVIIAALGLLFALLLPALLRVRAAAARAQSTNNMKQLALACHNYHSTFNTLPPGNDANNFSASAYLLPYIEQDNVFKLIDFKKPSTDPANATVRGVLIKTFLNPRDPQMAVVEGSGATNYLFCAGSKPALKDNDGVFFQDSKIKFQDILDGTSNTLMIGETLKGDGGKKAVDVRRQHVALDKKGLDNLKDEAGVAEWKENVHIAGDRCSAWIDGRFLQGTFTGTHVLNDPRPDVSCGGAGGLSGLRSLEDTVPAAICDGSVRMVNQKVALDVWKALSGRNDGIAVPNF
jgi:type II secretory pathway pseudopilin PulG